MAGLVPTIPVSLERPPLRECEDGSFRVGQSRIALDLIVEQYQHGMTPEEMVSAYDALKLADVYAVVGYYLRYQAQVEDDLRHRRHEAELLQRQIERDRAPLSRALLPDNLVLESVAMLRLATNADVHGDNIRGLYRRVPDIDLIRVQDALPAGTEDPTVVEWAAAQDRALVTNDRNTMVGHTYARVKAGDAVSGLIVTSSVQSIGQAIDDIQLIAECISATEIRTLAIVYLPLSV